MTRLVCLELWKLRKTAGAAMAALAVLACVLSCTLYRNYVLYYVLDKWEIGMDIFRLVFPLCVTIPVCWQIFYERRDRFLVYTLPRVSPRRYLWAKWIACALAAFLILFVPYALSGVCAIWLAPYQELHPEWITPYFHTLQTLYTRYPLVYVLLLSFWKGLMGVLTMTFGFVLGMFSSNLFVVLTGSFVYVLLDNFFWGIQRKALAFVAAFEPAALAPDAITPLAVLWGPVQMILAILLCAFFCTRVRKRPVYPL